MDKYTNVIGGSPTDLNIPLKVKERRVLAADYQSVIFEKPKSLQYIPGDWVDIRFLSKELSIGKTFSFASSPTEPDIMIAFKRGISSYKKALEVVETGDILLITEYGRHDFILDKRYFSVFIAGGIGITPFRSMIKEAIDSGTKTEMTLIYQNHTSDFPFQEEFNAWAKDYPYLKIHYVVTGTDGRITKEKLLSLVPDINERMNYLAGPPSMVQNVEQMLHNLGVKPEDIKTDSFTGY